MTDYKDFSNEQLIFEAIKVIMERLDQLDCAVIPNDNSEHIDLYWHGLLAEVYKRGS